MRSTLAAVALIVTSFAGVFADATPPPARGVFVYSTLCRGPEDTGGEEFVVMLLPGGPKVTYQYTEGAIMAPLLAFGPDALIDERTGQVHWRFVLTDSPTGKPETLVFDGNITDEALTVKSTRSGREVRLPRITQIPDRLPRCRSDRR